MREHREKTIKETTRILQMNNTVLRSIEKHLLEVLCEQSVRKELRYFLENNVVFDGEGEEVEFSVNDFDWTLSLDLKVAE